MNKLTHDLLLILIMAVITILLRVLPFLIFSEKRPVPKIVTALGNVLPYAVMGMLVVYCLKSVSVTSYPFGLPELIAIAVVVLTYVWKKKTIISILSGTVIYMLLIQLVFV